MKNFFRKIIKKLFLVNNYPEWVRVSSGPLKDYELFMDIKSFSGWSEMVSGNYDSFIFNEIKKINIKGMTVWDIGAHFGYHSLTFAALVGDKGHIYSFEPNPFNLDRFKLNIAKNQELNKRITLIAKALSDKDGEDMFVFSNDVDGSRSSGSHLVGAATPLLDSTYLNFLRKNVETIRIDTLLTEAEVSIPDIIKIDVEGAELMVLNGSKAFFEKYKPIIFMEVHNILMMFYVQKFLTELGYEITVLNESESTLSRCFIMAKIN
jgi:FkbM family methyltransferase